MPFKYCNTVYIFRGKIVEKVYISYYWFAVSNLIFACHMRRLMNNSLTEEIIPAASRSNGKTAIDSLNTCLFDDKDRTPSCAVFAIHTTKR